jgi:aspartyl-tRNA(Asn)/glutamyl-tRNA(Gln) amidotransferase subunit B
MLGELLRLLHAEDIELAASRVTPRHVAGIVGLVADGTLSTTLAKQVFERMFATGKEAAVVVREENLVQVTDQEALEAIVRDVMEQNPQAVADYRAGKTVALRSLMGKVMAATRGKADPTVSREILQRLLDVGDVGG